MILTTYKSWDDPPYVPINQVECRVASGDCHYHLLTQLSRCSGVNDAHDLLCVSKMISKFHG